MAWPGQNSPPNTVHALIKPAVKIGANSTGFMRTTPIEVAKSETRWLWSTISGWIDPNRMRLRPYQAACVQIVKQENVIINLPTGKGKTLIAVRAIDFFLVKSPIQKVCVALDTLTNQHQNRAVTDLSCA